MLALSLEKPLGYTALALLFALSTIVWVLHRTLTSPLRSLPGPLYSRFTNLVLKYHIFTGRRIFYVHALHQKYGSVVRISPDEVAVCDPAAHREVYRIGSGFVKAPWYETITPGMESNVFSMTNVHEHATRRRLLARPFSRSSLLNHVQGLVRERAKFAVDRIKEEAARGPCDVMKWWTLMTLDVIMEVAFGEKGGLLEAGKKNQFIHDLEQTERSFSFQGETPWLYRFMKLVKPGTYAGIDTALENVVAKATLAAQKAKDGKLSRYNILSGMIEASRKEGAIVNDFGLGSQASALVIAGSGTTSSTLTYATWVLLLYPEVRQKLRDEVAQLSAELDDLALEKLPYMSAFVTEVLRLYGSAPGGLPRTVPASGISIGGYHVPSGTTLTTQAYSMHRDPSIFEDPKRFDPERFMHREMSADQKYSFTPFGGGTRVCLGIHLAMMELRHGIAEFVRHCGHLQLSELTSPESMEFENYFLVVPKGHCLMVDDAGGTKA